MNASASVNSMSVDSTSGVEGPGVASAAVEGPGVTGTAVEGAGVAGAVALDPATGAPVGVSKVLVLTAHPDDVDFGAAGTLARWAAGGIDIHLTVVTGGGAGGFSDEARGDDVVSRRREEQREAAEVVGIASVEFWDYPDGDLHVSDELLKDIVEIGRRVRPDLILTHHPERDYTSFQKSHPDHLAVGQAVTHAVYPSLENPYAYPELLEAGLEPHKLRHLWYFGQPRRLTNMAVDITASLETKIEALLKHASQHPDVEKMQQFVRHQAARIAQQLTASDDARAAESFHAVCVNSAETIAGF